MFHSEILASLNFNKKFFFVHGIGEQPYTEMLFRQFSNILIYFKIVGKIPDQHLNKWLFSNPEDKVQKDEALRDKFVPYFQQESIHCPLDWRITIHSTVYLVFLQES